MTERITLTDTLLSSIIKLGEGNPGALRVLNEIVKREDDPDSLAGTLGTLGTLLSLDSYGIYGARIWMLYKDVCSEDLVRMLGLLQATRLGAVSEAVLNRAIDNRGDGLDLEAALTTVQELLPRFGGGIFSKA